jgi:hypothetical protein
LELAFGAVCETAVVENETENVPVKNANKAKTESVFILASKIRYLNFDISIERLAPVKERPDGGP